METVPLQLSLFDVPAEPPRPPGGRILIASGPVAAEGLLLERLDALLVEIRRDPSRLGRPVRIVVPSRSLRLHLASALVRRRGRSVAGVSIQTLFGLASEVVERAGEVIPRGETLFEVLAQRAAKAEPVLRRGLEDLADGFAAVTGTVRDLLDAGLEPVHAEAAEEALASDGPLVASRAEVDRARALVRAAARTEEWMGEMGLGRASTLLRRAAELVAEGRGLPAEAMLIHGFADATGVATDFLEALLKKQGAWLILDHPPKPEGGGVERSFSDRFLERVSSVASLEGQKGQEGQRTSGTGEAEPRSGMGLLWGWGLLRRWGLRRRFGSWRGGFGAFWMAARGRRGLGWWPGASTLSGWLCGGISTGWGFLFPAWGSGGR